QRQRCARPRPLWTSTARRQAAELDDAAVPSALDGTPAMGRDGGIDQIAASFRARSCAVLSLSWISIDKP
ncbi:MAG TPA: hypothetical protein VGG77_11255, partial [Roseiarcus sp.]